MTIKVFWYRHIRNIMICDCGCLDFNVATYSNQWRIYGHYYCCKICGKDNEKIDRL
jgi:hypothetical protein